MSILAERTESINIPTEREGYRAFIARLDLATRLLLFGVAPDATTFRCPTNGRQYTDDAPQLIDGAIWTRCYWCDTQGRVRGIDRDFDRASPQPHSNPIVRE